jgi:beta-lactamase regulating signal transducer with metallopeptidase domain
MNAFGIALVWCAAQVTLIGALAAGLYLAIRRPRPAAAFSVVFTCMVVVIGLSFMTMSPWPRWTIRRNSAVYAENKPEPIGAAEDKTPFAGRFKTLPNEKAGEAVDQNERIPNINNKTAPIGGAERDSDQGRTSLFAQIWQWLSDELTKPRPADSTNTWQWPAVAGALLLVSMVLGLGWLMLGILAVRRERLRSCPVLDRELLELMDSLRSELDCRRTIEVRQSDNLTTAATIGWRRPAILLPADWPAWTAAQRRAVLGHEIAHSRGHDFLALLFGQFALVLHYYHPLLHWLMNRLRLQQELAADAAAACVSGGQTMYLRTIAELALQQRERPLRWPARAFLPSRTTFYRRITMLRDTELRFDRLSLAVRLTTIGIVLLCGLLAAGIRGPGNESAQAMAVPGSAEANQPPLPASEAKSDERLWSRLGDEVSGLQCRLKVPDRVEQGMPLETEIELFSVPGHLSPGVTLLNRFLADTSVELTLLDPRTKETVTIRPYDPTSGMPSQDDGKQVEELGKSLPISIKNSFPLSTVWSALKPGIYEARVRYAFPGRYQKSWWQGAPDKWGAIWQGTVVSAPMTLNVLPAAPKTETLSLPKQLRLLPGMEIGYTKQDAEDVKVARRNGFTIGTSIIGSQTSGTRSRAPKPDDVNPIGRLVNYTGGDVKVSYKIVVFETADKPGHGWAPRPGSGDYLELWSKTFDLSLTEKEIKESVAQSPERPKSKIPRPAPASDQKKTVTEIEKLGGRTTNSIMPLYLSGSIKPKSQDEPVVGIDFTDSQLITDAGLTNLKDLPQINILHLTNTKITDAGLANLKGMTQLQSLQLQGTSITGSGLVNLKGMSQLESLRLAGTQITDAGLENLKGFAQLQKLDLADTKTTDAGMENLKGLTKIQVLELSSTNITDAGLANLTGLSQLGMLYLRDTKINGTGLVFLQGLSQLDLLNLSGAKITDAGMQNIKSLTQVRHLELINTGIGDAGLESLKESTQLRVLYLSGTKITDAGLPNLKGLTHLMSLYLNNTNVTDAGVKDLQKALPGCEIKKQ